MKKRSLFELEQMEMLKNLQILSDERSIALQPDSKIITLDVQYMNEWGYAGMDVLEWGSKKSQVIVAKEPVQEEYQPGFFSFREGPIIQAVVEKLTKLQNIVPSLLIMDGHGVAHPRRMGLASWVGVKMDLPTIGVCKESLLKIDYELGESAGSTFEIKESGEVIGTVLRTQDSVNPVFVSAGHKISQLESVKIIMALRGKYRNIEPIRRADQAARKYANGIIDEKMIELI